VLKTARGPAENAWTELVAEELSSMRLPRFAFLLPLTIAGLLVGPAAVGKTDRGTWRSFTGAWFKIDYPGDFSVLPSLVSRTSASGYDSAFFRSPDGLVEFYVYSPQWGGEPSDVALDPSSEVAAAEKTVHKNGSRTTWLTFAARDRSYTRSLVDTEHSGQNTRLVFGIKYRDQRAYDAYKPAYLQFKASLEQYAD
jgi:hypothetical protein